jgi:hypothetical protein
LLRLVARARQWPLNCRRCTKMASPNTRP